ncbi:dTMP kinase [Corynebacterium aquatimens]|uniref:Thymidylate kinase n=1 Tax=Corynebacterium aquatimens TaxID=1190508 RepID=A0A931DZW0_9CORY|nr:dTMP kinase [Corynebacterium aquatimens]MBG6123155.1 dTMP kinase [Corynebacterium aquatimens]WJY66514.1 Thymidylate kinase [Corynebacterium aquatimens]
MIIAIEGIDGAGKNTLTGTLIHGLEAAGLQADRLAFPRYADSIHAQLAADALHGKMGDLTDSAHAMATLFALDRYGAKAELEAYSGSGDRVLILDRYVASNAAYTSARTGNASDRQWVYDLEFGRFGVPLPDAQVLVDTSPAIARDRAQRREENDASRTRDRYERDAALQDATFAAYRDLARDLWAGRWITTMDAQPIIEFVLKMTSKGHP